MKTQSKRITSIKTRIKTGVEWTETSMTAYVKE